MVDASVVVKWVMPEEHSESAARLLSEELELWAPDLLWPESGNILWKKWLRQELSEEKVPSLLQTLQSFPLNILPSERLVEEAWEIARDFRRSFYDSLYLALAIYQECPMVTADRRLYNAVGGASSRLPILWIEDIP
ncbi:MAG TPA: type II toxin-antitoxin system VapC family toxin [Thermoanaerobaculia bacterium]